jgi:hypothetical protein
MNSTPISLTPAQQAQVNREVANEGYAERELIDVDIFANETLGGKTGETLSSRFGRWSLRPTGIRGAIGRFMVRTLNIAQDNHCGQAIAGDKARGAALVQTEDNSGVLLK